jgi:hypothetical protein
MYVTSATQELRRDVQRFTPCRGIGYRRSGIGRELSIEGFLEFSEAHTVYPR